MNREFGLAPGEFALLPPLRARMMSVLWNPRADFDAFVALIEPDSTLTVAVLRAANSAHSSPRMPIRSARVAMIRLGLDMIRQIVVAALMRSQFEHLGDAGLDARVTWKRQLAVGLLTHDFARYDRCSRDEIGVAFVVGLLHRVGRLALVARSAQRYRSVVQLVREGADALDAERQAFGVDSLEMTRQIAGRWDFSPEVADALERQVDPRAPGLAFALRDAIDMADLLGFGEGFDELAPTHLALPADHPRALQFDETGGVERLYQRIERFTETSVERASVPSAADVRARRPDMRGIDSTGEPEIRRAA